MPRTDRVELCRTQIARVADALEVLIEQHGTIAQASATTSVGREFFSKFAKRGAYEIVMPESLAQVAQAHGITVEQLLGGKGPKPKLRRKA
jgi:hypothetical protein